MQLFIPSTLLKTVYRVSAFHCKVTYTYTLPIALLFTTNKICFISLVSFSATCQYSTRTLDSGNLSTLLFPPARIVLVIKYVPVHFSNPFHLAQTPYNPIIVETILIGNNYGVQGQHGTRCSLMPGTPTSTGSF